jgi:hypothetical protein
MAGRIYFSFLFCLLTSPLINVLWAELYGLKFGWILALDFIFVISAIAFLSGIDNLEREINKLKVCNENRVREIVGLEREIDNIKGKGKT